MFKKLISIVNNAVGWGRSEDSDISDEEDAGITETGDLMDRINVMISSEEELQENIPLQPAPLNVLRTQHRIGIITNLSQNDGVIDSKYFFDRRDAPSRGLSVGKSVTYHAFRNSDDQEWRVTKIIAIHDESWNDEDEDESVPVVEVAAQPVEEDLVIQENTANKRTIIGKVQLREGREVVVRDCLQRLSGGIVPRDTRFTLDAVISEFTPLQGDIVSMDSIVEVSEETLDGSGDVVQVLSIKPSRARMTEGIVTKWNKYQRCGDISDDIYFMRDACESGYIPRLKDEVKVEIIECERREYKWRAISVHPITLSQHQEYPKASERIYHIIDPELVKNKCNLNVQENTNFKSLPALGNYKIEVSVTNEGDIKKLISKYYIETKPSCLTLLSPKTKTVMIEPQDTVIFSFDYERSMCGFFSEVFVIECANSQIGRLLEWEVFTSEIPASSPTVMDEKCYQNTRHKMAQKCLELQESRVSCVPGVRPNKSLSFSKFRMPIFAMPDQIKKAMTSGIEDSLLSRKDAVKALREQYADLDQQLSASNHARRFHLLLFIAEMDGQIDICRYSKERVNFVRRGPAGDFLALEIPGLAEGRPSLLVGDSVVVKNSWGTQGSRFQGFVHKVLSNEVWLKFNANFHNTYNSEDYDVYFELSRGSFRKCHTAIDICHAQQANLWLFPKGVRSKPPQVALEEDVSDTVLDIDNLNSASVINEHADSKHAVSNGEKSVQSFIESFKSSPEKSRLSSNVELVHVNDVEKSFEKVYGSSKQALRPKQVSAPNGTNTVDSYSQRRKKLVWVNKRLNFRQKEAVKNILLGEARPLPYIIFGPPGTGKTITLVETILQIYMQISDSRLLIATPSNSSANLIAERLLDSNLLQPGDMIRLVANHLAADGKIPPRLVPYSATVDSHDKDEQDSKGFLSLNSRLIINHRITIGTCVALGQIITLGLPRGHYSHIVVDEAGQATEPEILIPLGFMAHESGQAILAGDPNQLGPVVQSHLAADFGLNKSLLARLLPRFPYQRDPTGFPESGGYDPRLVTRLSVNYRSLPDILELPSSLFYDSDLEAWITEEDSYESKLLARATAHLNLPNSAVVFRGIKGSTCRHSDSPSFWNPQECFEVIKYVRQLLDAQIKREDIGIITPYQKQAMQIKHLLEKLDVEDEDNTSGVIKVGSVEEFQGQERMVIILSTVRSLGAGHIQTIGRRTAKQLLGFVNNPERLNVAISRARALLLICGDPEVLCVDYYWRSVVKYCIDRKSFIGAAIPNYLLEN